MGIWRWLRHRRWFWPWALWTGLNWAITLSSHPVVRVCEIVFFILALFGAAVVIRHADPFFIALFAAILFLAIWAKGARHKWLDDTNGRPPAGEPSKSSPPVQLPPGSHEVWEDERGRTMIRPLREDEDES